MIKVAIGHSTDLNTEDAIDEILGQCSEQLIDGSVSCGFLYASIDQDFTVLLEKVK